MFTTLILVGCTSNSQLRDNYDSVGGDRNRAVIENPGAYTLGFIEFDDQGQFRDPRQLTAVQEMIQNQAGLSPGQTPTPIVLVAFVHGWKDNAEHNNLGVSAMRSILAEFSKAERSQTDHTPRKVVGVYLGWRGLSQTIEPFKELSFWERKIASQKVGGYGGMTRVLVSLEAIQQQSLAAIKGSSSPTQLIIIGHSMGADAVYCALGQIIADRFVDSIEVHHKRLKPVGDQIILLNPAFEAQRHFSLNQMAWDAASYPGDQRPVLSIFTSTGDWATHYIFPIGQVLSTLLDADTDHEQANRGRVTVGWYAPYITHHLALVPGDESPSATTEPATQAVVAGHNMNRRRSFENVEQERSKYKSNAPQAQRYTFDNVMLDPIHYRPGDPFIIASVDPEIMADHTDITNPNLIRFIRNYVQFCESDPRTSDK